MQGSSQTPGIQSSPVSSSCRPHGFQIDIITTEVKTQTVARAEPVPGKH